MATSTPALAVNTDNSRHVLDSIKVLSECCSNRIACRFQLVHNDESMHAVFKSLSSKGVELRMTSEDFEEPMSREAICCVSFSHETSFCAFLGCVLEVNEYGPRDHGMIVTVPKQLTITNLRRFYRVPVIPQAGVQTTIRTADGREFVVVVRDIAESGVEIEVNTANDPILAVGSSVDVELRFRDEVIKRAAEVRRLVGTRCGLLFRDGGRNPDRHLSANLHEMVMALQKVWLKHRSS